MQTNTLPICLVKIFASRNANNFHGVVGVQTPPLQPPGLQRETAILTLPHLRSSSLEQFRWCELHLLFNRGIYQRFYYQPIITIVDRLQLILPFSLNLICCSSSSCVYIAQSFMQHFLLTVAQQHVYLPPPPQIISFHTWGHPAFRSNFKLHAYNSW